MHTGIVLRYFGSTPVQPDPPANTKAQLLTPTEHTEVSYECFLPVDRSVTGKRFECLFSDA